MAQRVRPNTLAAYRFNAENYLVPDLGTKRLRKLSARDVRLYLVELERRGVGARTIRYVHATLRAALEDAVREELLEQERRQAGAGPLCAPVGAASVDGGGAAGAASCATQEHRLRALLVVVALLGLRRSEALGLRWTDVDLEPVAVAGASRAAPGRGAAVRCCRRRPRGRGGPFRCRRWWCEELAAHRERQELERRGLAEGWPESGFVFTTPIGTPIDPDNCSKIVKPAVQAAGLRDVRMHDFRHGVVSVLLGLGVPPRTVMEIAGHSGLEMTMNVYAHVTLDDKREALDRLERAVRGGAEMSPLLSAVAVSRAAAAVAVDGGRGSGSTKPQVSGGLPAVRVWRAWRDSNSQPSDP